MLLTRHNSAFNHAALRRSPIVRLASAAAISLTLFTLTTPAPAQNGIYRDREPGLPNITPEPLKGVELKNKLGAQIPLDLQFTTSDNRKVLLGDLFGRLIGGKEALGAKRPVVLMLMYHRCPMLCPMVLDKFTQQLRGLESPKGDMQVGREFDAVIVSFDERDIPKNSAEAKAGSLVSLGRDDDAAKTGWTFLTGPAANSAELARSMGFAYRWLPESGQFAHGAVIFVLTPDGKVSRYITDLTATSTDLRLALVEASSGAIGSWSDQFMLRCLHFNPATGKYSASAMRLAQLTGIVCILGVGGYIVASLRREKKRRAAARASAPVNPDQPTHPSPASHALASGHAR